MNKFNLNRMIQFKFKISLGIYSENWLTRNPWCKSKYFSLSGLHIHVRHSLNVVDYFNSTHRNENINHNNSIRVLTAMLFNH